jgi:hypothetical protein
MSTQRQFNARPPIEQVPGQARFSDNYAGRGNSSGGGQGRSKRGAKESGGDDVNRDGKTKQSLEIGLSASALNSVMRQWK